MTEERRNDLPESKERALQSASECQTSQNAERTIGKQLNKYLYVWEKNGGCVHVCLQRHRCMNISFPRVDISVVNSSLRESALQGQVRGRPASNRFRETNNNIQLYMVDKLKPNHMLLIDMDGNIFQLGLKLLWFVFCGRE